MNLHPWEIIADVLRRTGWSWGVTRAFTDRRFVFVVDAHRDDGHRYVVHAEDQTRAFEELLRAVTDAGE